MLNITFPLTNSLVQKNFSNLDFTMTLPFILLYMIIIYKIKEIKEKRNIHNIFILIYLTYQTTSNS